MDFARKTQCGVERGSRCPRGSLGPPTAPRGRSGVWRKGLPQSNAPGFAGLSFITEAVMVHSHLFDI